MAPNRHSVDEHHPVRRAGAKPCLLLLVLLLFGSQAAAVEYPVDGVWVALNPAFPAAEDEICFAVRTFGVAAVSRKSVSEIMIFSKDRRYDLEGDIQKQATASSVKPEFQGYRITETLKMRHRWLGFRRKMTYLLAIVDPRRIEIRNRLGVRRYVKCGPQKSTI